MSDTSTDHRREEGGLGKAHELDSERRHYTWDNSLQPRIVIESGDVVTVEMRSASDDFYTRSSTAADVLLRPVRGHALSGPIAIAGARPGDILQIELLDISTRGWGYTQIAPGRGLLPEDFPEPYLAIWEIADCAVAQSLPGVQVPVEPFLGVIGVAPSQPGEHATTPPRVSGGNLDIKHLVAGATLWIPIEVEGALLSLGDPHAAQGDGEVCVNAIETGATATFRATLQRDRSLPGPQLRTPGPITPRTNAGPWYATTGIGPDLLDATKQATRAMLRHLQETYGFSAVDAYVLASVAVDLKLSEVVNRPNWVVSAFLPLNIFE